MEACDGAEVTSKPFLLMIDFLKIHSIYIRSAEEQLVLEPWRLVTEPKFGNKPFLFLKSCGGDVDRASYKISDSSHL